ncbi:MAG: hypothetical protein IJO40_10615 [Thermoguttaceae bacterium]|nr:hypothetical protein [Thermoguttaceae bacterium]
MSTIYRLHLAETPKGNLKYGWLDKNSETRSWRRKLLEVATDRLNPFGRTILKSSTLIKTKSGATSRPPGLI